MFVLSNQYATKKLIYAAECVLLEALDFLDALTTECKTQTALTYVVKTANFESHF
jgi:hypothetical protein